MDTTNPSNPLPSTNPIVQNPLQQPQAVEQKIYKILVVDDEPDARTIFRDMISSNPNYEVSVAEDGTDALAKCEATKFDLVLMDIVMPKKDGVQALSEIKADPDKYGTPKVLMLTNIGGDLAVEEAMKIGAIGYKVKIDTDLDILMQIIADIFSGKFEADAANRHVS
jgi:CheY-like chemotaxis protein